jgi:hypothetical protein
MQLQDGQIVIKPVKRKLREGWFDRPLGLNAPPHDAAEAAETQLWEAAPTTDDSEWTW